AGMHARAVVVAAAVAFAAARQAPIVTEAQTPPDLDGVWTFSTLTPLERPAEFAGKPSLTDREAAEFEKRTIERNDRDRRGQNAELDVNGAYNEAWFERGTRLAVVNGRRRTSLIVDPDDGRVPPLTPDAQRRAAERAEERRQH